LISPDPITCNRRQKKKKKEKRKKSMERKEKKRKKISALVSEPPLPLFVLLLRGQG